MPNTSATWRLRPSTCRTDSWRTWVDSQDARIQLATGGDDYQIAFTAAADDEAALRRAADAQHLRLTTLGRVVEGTGVTVLSAGGVIDIPHPGWTHG